MKKIVDFMTDADNVYSTLDYIVAQHFMFSLTTKGSSQLVSIDRFYKKTPERIKQYSSLFGKSPIVSGGRIHSELYTRKYID